MLAARELIVVNILSAQGSFTNTVWQSLHMAYLPKQESKQLKLVLAIHLAFHTVVIWTNGQENIKAAQFNLESTNFRVSALQHSI